MFHRGAPELRWLTLAGGPGDTVRRRVGSGHTSHLVRQASGDPVTTGLLQEDTRRVPDAAAGRMSPGPALVRTSQWWWGRVPHIF